MERTPLTNVREITNLADREEAAAIIIKKNLDEVRRDYGPDGRRPLYYHDQVHSLDVVDAATQLGELAVTNGKIMPYQLPNLRIGGSGHDRVHELGSPYDEQESAKLNAVDMLLSDVFDDEDIDENKTMILATTTSIDDGGIMRQSASLSHYPSMLLADADLASLGKSPEMYWDRALRFLKETIGNPQPTDEQKAAFAISQEKFLRNHEFYTEEARQLFPHKADNIEYTADIGRYYRARDIGHSAIIRA